MSGVMRAWESVCRIALYCLAALLIVALSGCTETETQTELNFEFYRANVEPIFIQSRGDFLPPDPGGPACVMCHTWQASTPLMLESLEIGDDGNAHWTEAQSRQNFEVVSRLVVPGDPQSSRLLQAPLSPQAGGSALHTGGKVWDSQNDSEWQVLAEWVRTGTALESTESIPDVDFEFFQACVQPIFFQVIPGGLACANCHSVGSAGGGGIEFTQTDPEESWSAASRFVEPGWPTQSRLLMHPLHPDGGGDYVHNGVRRWLSQDDPEWQMLAAWISGDRTGTDCRP